MCVHVLLIGVLLSSLSHVTASSMDGLVHQLAVIRCAVHNGIHVLWKLLFTRSVRSIVDLCVCERSSDEQVQAASLLQECVMVRDGLSFARCFYCWRYVRHCSVSVSVLTVLSFCLSCF